MDTLNIIYIVLSAVLGVAGAIFGAIVKIRAIKNGNDKDSRLEAAGEVIKETNNISQCIVDLVFKIIPEAMKGVELSNMTGEAKKTVVKSKVSLYCQSKDYKYDDELVDKAIELFIDISKTINNRIKKAEVVNVSSSNSQNSPV